MIHHKYGANINGVWNLVLSNSEVNRSKRTKIPHERYLNRLFNRNEFFIDSKHPLAETIIRQTGITKEQRRIFLQQHYQIASDCLIHNKWEPEFELQSTF